MYLIMNCGERCQDMNNHHNYLAVVKLEPEKNSGLNQIRTHCDLCDTGGYAVQWNCDYHSCLYVIFNTVEPRYNEVSRYRESLGELEKAVETLTCGSCSHSISRSPKLPLVIV